MSATPSPGPYAPVVHDDGDYEYFWTRGEHDIRVPRWMAEILDVPLMVRLELFLGGVCVGLVLAATTLLVAFYLAVG